VKEPYKGKIAAEAKVEAGTERKLHELQTMMNGPGCMNHDPFTMQLRFMPFVAVSCPFLCFRLRSL